MSEDLSAAIDRLETLFAGREPEVQAFMPEDGRFERLRREAEALLARWPDPAQRPPLFGVLAGVKDVFRADGFETRAGSRLPPEEFQGPEAPSVTALKEAGALLVGKTVSTEFAFFAPGPTRNPWNPEHTPGGSSSGSAAAVGAGLCQVALGTQTIGSIIRPAAFCGAVGFKPSYDRISRDGVIPLAPSFDHVGFFTPDCEMAKRAAAALIPGWRPASQALPVRRPRLGVPEGPYLERAVGEGLIHFREVCKRLEGAGYAVERFPSMDDFAEIAERQFRIVAAEAARVHHDWFARYGDLYHPKTVDLIERGRKVTDETLKRDLTRPKVVRTVLVTQMIDWGFDLWISPPALGAAPRGLESTGDPVMNIPWTQAGLPTVCLPAGRNAAGLPMGLQVAGGRGTDEELLEWAGEMERVLQ